MDLRQSTNHEGREMTAVTECVDILMAPGWLTPAMSAHAW